MTSIFRRLKPSVSLSNFLQNKTLMGEVLKEATFSLAEANFQAGNFGSVLLQVSAASCSFSFSPCKPCTLCSVNNSAVKSLCRMSTRPASLCDHRKTTWRVSNSRFLNPLPTAAAVSGSEIKSKFYMLSFANLAFFPLCRRVRRI